MDARQDLGSIPHSVRVWRRASAFGEVQSEVTKMRAYLEDVIVAALPAEGATRGQAFDKFLNWRDDNGDYEARFKRPYLDAKMRIDPSFKT